MTITPVIQAAIYAYTADVERSRREYQLHPSLGVYDGRYYSPKNAGSSKRAAA